MPLLLNVLTATLFCYEVCKQQHQEKLWHRKKDRELNWCTECTMTSLLLRWM